MSTSPSIFSSSRNRTGVLIGIGAVLLWLVITRSVAAALAVSHPTMALFLQPAEPRALVQLATSGLNALTNADGHNLSLSEVDDTAGEASGVSNFSGLSEGAQRLSEQRQIESAAGKARLAIAAYPLSAEAVGVLARLSDFQPNGKTPGLMQAAVQLSMRQSYAMYWLLLEAQRNGDTADMLRYADRLLRSRPQTLSLVLKNLGQLAENELGARELEGVLGTYPPWRSQVLGKLPSNVTDARTPLYILLGLRGTPHPPTQAEISTYITFLIRQNLHELAYYTWLQFLPAEQLGSLSPLQNGGFDEPVSGSAFDWTLSQGVATTSEIRPRPDTAEGKALFVEFSEGRAEFAGVSQTVLLAPGPYTLTGRFKGRLIGQRGLVWRMSCAGNSATIGQTDLIRGEVPQWRPFELKVTIPEDGCRAQQIRLVLDARSASEKFVTGSMWFDDLALERMR